MNDSVRVWMRRTEFMSHGRGQGQSQFISCRLHEEKQSRWVGCKLFGAFDRAQKPHFVALFGRLRQQTVPPMVPHTDASGESRPRSVPSFQVVCEHGT
jgi:hypothetical protein